VAYNSDMVGFRSFLFLIAVAGCGSVRNNPGDGSVGTTDGSSGSDGGAQCGTRGLACCAGKCDARSSCDGTVCIAADVWASGADGTFDFNGGAWTHPLLAGSTAQLPPVNGLWGTTSSFVVGVGNAALILRYDGTGWRKDVPARADGTGTLFGVAGSGASDVWAVGDAHFAHYTGSGWLDVTPPATNGEAYLAVWLSGPGEGWACGQAGILAHLSGGTWTGAGRLGGSFGRNGLWGSGPSDVWMVGFKHSLATGLPLSIEHYDGTAWTNGAGMLDPQGTLPPLNAVWGSDATHVWAVGENGTIVFWNGQLWKSVLSGTTDKLSAVWGSGPNDVWVAGAGGMRHFNGTTWAPVPGLSSPPTAVWLSQQ
jgi:hypothetical protein